MASFANEKMSLKLLKKTSSGRILPETFSVREPISAQQPNFNGIFIVLK